jgi:diguanylate cyclase (GGDEF)-like protein
MRLVTRRDTSLAVALIASTVVAFKRPFHWGLGFVHDLEARYDLDLLPALTLLSVVFVVHAYKKRVQVREELATLTGDMDRTRARTAELERLMSLGRTLANALDRATLEQQLWRALPAIVGIRECTILTRHTAGWDVLIRDNAMLRRLSSEALEALVSQVPPSRLVDAAREGEACGADLCFPMIAGDLVMGAIIVRHEPPLRVEERLAIGGAGALIAIASRNAYLLHDARQSGARDGLTGCFTRAHALEVLHHELRRARRTNTPVSLIMFDLDGFKEINDRDGHLQGDAVLASIGTQLNHILRSTDIRCRYGGDEFMLILPDTAMMGAQQVAEALRREIAEMPREGATQLFVTASLGIAAALPGELDMLALIARADEALYRAKRAGRNRCCVSPPPGVVPSAALARAT